MVDEKRESGPVRVLVVDDIKAVGTGIKIALGKRGYEIETASTFDRAIELAQACSYAVALIDFKLERGSRRTGLDIARVLKAKDARTQVLFITGYKGELGYEGVRECEAVCIEKPFSSEQLIEQVDTAAARFSKAAPPPGS